METLMEVKNLNKFFPVKNGLLKAVNDVSFEIRKGETLGVVGESGCGKTTCGRVCTGIYPKTSGSVKYRGREVEEYKKTDPLEFARKVQCVFQDPYASLNPRMKVQDILEEGIRVHRLAESREERKEMARELLEQVGLRAEYGIRFPHEFSGGQRQRIGIARALSVHPEFLFCDEPVSALDVSVQAQVMNLFMELQEQRGLTYLFVSHDISMVRHISDRIAVFYMGKLVEIADADELYYHAVHPYTKALLSAVLIPEPEKTIRKRIRLSGDVPSPVNPPDGCVFYKRCPYADRECAGWHMQQKEIISGHFCACRKISRR